MGNENKDVKRVEKTEAQIEAGGIIQQQLGHASDTDSLIYRDSGDNYIEYRAYLDGYIVDDSHFVGLSDSTARLVFNDEATDDVTVESADFIINGGDTYFKYDADSYTKFSVDDATGALVIEPIGDESDGCVGIGGSPSNCSYDNGLETQGEIWANGIITSKRSGGDTVSQLSVIDTAAGSATAGPIFDLYRSAEGDADDVLAAINFNGQNDAGEPEKILYAQMRAEIKTETDESEDGRFVFEVMDGGTISTDHLVLDKDGLSLNGRIELRSTVALSSSSDNLDVVNSSVVIANTSGGDITLGGLVGGVTGQVLFIFKSTAANTLTIEHDENTGNQDIITADTNDISLTNYGGVTLVYDGSNWHEVGH